MVSSSDHDSILPVIDLLTGLLDKGHFKIDLLKDQC